MANFKVKNGLEASRYLQTVGTVTATTSNYGIQGAVYEKRIDTSTQDTIPYDIFFKPDGTKMYILGRANDTVYQYALSTAWDISTATFETGKSKSVTTDEDQPNGLFFKDDGTKMYITGTGGDDMHHYTLSTAWDVSTATVQSGVLTLSGQMNNPNGMSISSDGLTVFVISDQNNDVFQYTLTTAWDITTGSYSGKSFSVANEGSSSRGVAFNSSGTQMFVMNDTEVHRYTLSTANDVSTASYDAVVLSTFPETGDAGVQKFVFSADGSKGYLASTGAFDGIIQYATVATTNTLDLSSGTYFSMSGTSGMDIAFSNPPPSGVGYAAQIEIENTDTSWRADEESYDYKRFEPYSQLGGSGNDVYISPDGTKMFCSSDADDIVYQFTLSTPYDVSTATYDSKNFDFTSFEGNLEAIFFKPDGTKIFLTGSSSDLIREFPLSTAWDISTVGSLTANLNSSGKDNFPTGIFIGDDGTKLYMVGTQSDAVHQYDLSTAWSLSGATFSKSFSSFQVVVGTVKGVWLSSDGKTLLTGNAQDCGIIQYTLDTAWDIATAYPSTRIYPRADMQDSSQMPEGFWVSEDENKLYLIGVRSQFDGFVKSNIFQFTVNGLGNGTVTWPNGIKWHRGLTPAASPNPSTKDTFTIFTKDGGTTYYGKKSGDSLS